MSKNIVPEEQKQTYLAYAREKHIKLGGASLYPVIKLHEHNRVFSQKVTEEQIQTATLVLEVVKPLFSDEELAENLYHKASGRSNLYPEGDTWEMLCIDMHAENSSILGKMVIHHDELSMPEPISPKTKILANAALKLPCSGDVQIMCGYTPKV